MKGLARLAGVVRALMTARHGLQAACGTVYDPTLGYIGWRGDYDMECIDRIRELSACVLLFSTCLLHRLRGLAMAFLRTQMRLRHKVRKREAPG